MFRALYNHGAQNPQTASGGSLLVVTDTNLTTRDGLQALEDELATLEGEGRREIAERIKVAREWGDLKENSEYHDAKNEQAHLETKIARLRERIVAAVIVEEGEESGSGTAGEAVRFGSTVLVRDEQGVEQSWRIVSSHEASPKEGRLSSESPVAAALLGHAVGECIAVSLPKGQRTLTIVSVS